MVRAAALIAVITMLPSCGTYSPANGWTASKTAETADIARVNSANALARIGALSDRIDQLETDKSDLESKVADLESDLSSAKLEIEAARAETNSLRSEFEGHKHGPY